MKRIDVIDVNHKDFMEFGLVFIFNEFSVLFYLIRDQDLIVCDMV